MSDVHINTRGLLGQSTWHDQEHLRPLLLQIRQQNPGVTRARRLELYLARAKRSPLMIEEALRRCFDNDERTIEKMERPRQRLDADDVKRVANVILLDLVLPNGKKLRDCTGRECKKAGGWLIQVGERVGDRGIVGAKLDEAELTAIRAGRSN